MDEDSAQKVRLAVFDFDGTCIEGQSGYLFSTYLRRRGYVPVSSALKLIWWGIRYVLHLPHRQAAPREIIFECLAHHTPDEVRQIMREFHDQVLVPRYRPKAIETIRQRKAEGCVTLLVSATFWSIAEAAADRLGVDGFIATTMEKDARGNFTGHVSGPVTEGDEKPRSVRRWADERYGSDGWMIEYAYGDHHSDEAMLSLARHPVAVSPGKTLAKVAKQRGWQIQDWSIDVH